jgi:hypothetical protein
MRRVCSMRSATISAYSPALTARPTSPASSSPIRRRSRTLLRRRDQEERQGDRELEQRAAGEGLQKLHIERIGDRRRPSTKSAAGNRHQRRPSKIQLLLFLW